MNALQNGQMNNEDIALLVDGKEAFPEILRQISLAQKSIKINMFIWRADKIGVEIARALLLAADRGVKIEISVDRYGFILESAEESMQSFFHKKPNFAEKIKIFAIKKFYKTKKVGFENLQEADFLKEKLLSHSNVKVEKDRFKADHSKYYVFDEKILVFGGINIEDKENGCDYLGRVYQDYMIETCDNRLIDELLNGFRDKKEEKLPYLGINSKAVFPHVFEMKERYLDILRSAEKEIFITMAYFSPVKEFLDEIKKACERGVKITVMIPNSANFQNDLNLKTVKKLLEITDGGVEVFLSPKMLHTKLMSNEKVVSLGSTNINKKAFNQLDELNLFIQKSESAFCRKLFASCEKNLSLATKVEKEDIRFSKFRAFIESIIM